MKQHQKIEKNITTPTIASLFWGKIMQEIKMFMFHIPCFLRKNLVKFPKKSHFNLKFDLVAYFFSILETYYYLLINCSWIFTINAMSKN